MVQDDMWKEEIYKLIAHSGIWAMQTIFPEYFATEPLRPTDRYIEYPWLLKHLPKDERLDILDVGSSGSMLPYLMNALGHKVSSIDIRPRQDVEANKEITFYHRDICNSCLPDNYFDIVTAISTIEHIGLEGRYGVDKQNSDIKAIEEIHRILKPNGILFMSVPFGKNKTTKTHHIYNGLAIPRLLCNFTYFNKFEKSPEANYDLALIEAVK